jgi:hypothetical protein
MKLKLSHYYDSDNMKIKFSGEYTPSELADLNLTEFDSALLREINSNPSPADLLLGLEMIFRRHEEQTK